MTTSNAVNQGTGSQPNQNSTIALESINTKLEVIIQKLDESKTELKYIDSSLKTIINQINSLGTIIINKSNEPKNKTDSWWFQLLVHGLVVGIILGLFNVLSAGLLEPYFNLWAPFLPINISAIQINLNGEKEIICEFIYQQARECKDEQGESVSLNSIVWANDEPIDVVISIWDENQRKYANNQISCKWNPLQEESSSKCEYNYPLGSEKERTLKVLISNTSLIPPFNHYPQELKINFKGKIND